MSFLYILIGVILLPVVTCDVNVPSPVLTPHIIPQDLDINKTECSLDNEDVLIHVTPVQTMIPVGQIVAKQNKNKCKVTSIDNVTYNITGCHKGSFVDVYFFENLDHITGGLHVKHFKIECKDLAKSGTIVKVTMNPEQVTDIATSKAPITAKLEISMAVTSFSVTSPKISESSFTIGDKYKLWIKGPENVYMYPETCNATSGKNSESYELVTNSCAEDRTVLDDFKPIHNDTHKGDLYATLYGFRFVSTKEVYLSCSIKVCPTLYCEETEYLQEHGKNEQCHDLILPTTTTAASSAPGASPAPTIKDSPGRKRRYIKENASSESGSRLRRDLHDKTRRKISGGKKPTVHEISMKLNVVDSPTEMSGSNQLYDAQSTILLLVSTLYTLARRYF